MYIRMRKEYWEIGKSVSMMEKEIRKLRRLGLYKNRELVVLLLMND